MPLLGPVECVLYLMAYVKVTTTIFFNIFLEFRTKIVRAGRFIVRHIPWCFGAFFDSNVLLNGYLC